MDSALDFVVTDGKLTEYRGAGGEVTVPEGVTGIAFGAFADPSILTAVHLPAGLQSLDYGAFMGSANLQRVTLPEGLAKIDGGAFMGCMGLKEINIPESVTAIESRAFYGCGALERISLPDGITEIGHSAFCGCASLREAAMPRGLKTLSNMAFGDCMSLPALELPEGFTSIGDNAFSGCTSLAEITLPQSLEKVGYSPFAYCRAEAVRVRRWKPQFTSALLNCEVTTVVTDDPESVPAEYRNAAALGYVRGQGNDPARRETFSAFLTAHAAALCAFAFEHTELLYFLCENRLIAAGDTDLFLRQAEALRDTEGKALILNYQNELGMEHLNAARREKEKSAEEYGDRWMDRAMERDEGVGGMHFAVSGSHRLMTARETIAVHLKALGAALDEDVTPETDYLVTDEPAGETEHHLRARELGVPLLTEQEFREMLGVEGDVYYGVLSISEI